MQSPSQRPPKRIGVFKFKNIGDVVLMTPALQTLHENFPDAQIHAVVNAETAPILIGNPALTSVIAYQRQIKGRNFWRRIFYEISFFLKLRRLRFDLTIDYDRGHRSGWYGFLCGARQHWSYLRYIDLVIGRLRWRTRFFSEPYTQGHQVNWHLQMLREVPLQVEQKPGLVLKIQPVDEAWAARLCAGLTGKKLVVVHPVARWLYKRWDPVKMAAVIDWLQTERDCHVMVSNGGVERELEKLNEIIALCRTPVQVLASGTTLGQLAALIARADCFFGIDTGPMHIAAAVGTPVVALFGPTHAENWAPWCEKSVVLQTPCLCASGETPPCQWQEIRYCLQSIQVTEAQAALDRFLSPVTETVR